MLQTLVYPFSLPITARYMCFHLCQEGYSTIHLLANASRIYSLQYILWVFEDILMACLIFYMAQDLIISREGQGANSSVTQCFSVFNFPLLC